MRVAALIFCLLPVLPALNAKAGLAPDPAKVRTWWAFQPVRHDIAPPAVQNAAWCRNEIDRFILAKLEKDGGKPPPSADARTLLRRLSFDLTGLPPSMDEVTAFEKEASLDAPGALQRATVRMLASPRYGERQARHWLDVARYADTKGYVYGREERFFVQAAVYRDWVVRAFNEDLPYDQFLRLQIAADQLVPAHSPDLAALGFITLGRRFLGVMHDIIDDRIDVVTRGTMGLTVQCARCHDHKFDPVTIRDYYALYGVFRACDDRLERLGPEVKIDELEKLTRKNAEGMKKRRDEAAGRIRAKIADYLAAQLELQKYPEEGFDEILGAEDVIPASARRWRDYLYTAAEGVHPIFAPWIALAKIPAAVFTQRAGIALEELRRDHGSSLNPRVAAAFATPPASMQEAAQRYGVLFKDAEAMPAPRDAAADALRDFLYAQDSPAIVPDCGIVNNEAYFLNDLREELWKLQSEVDRWIIKNNTAPPHAMVLADHGVEPPPRVFKRGSPAQPGDEVPRRFLSFLTDGKEIPFQHGSGRLELAGAIVDPRNPLTARVMVNRIWQQHFGEGIVRTASDFGLRAEPPSHPELLDWLAARFIDSGWSVKAMHRLIVASAAWQSRDLPQRRLDFEQVRDSLLAATGELDLKAGGKPEDSLAAGSRRRTLYGLVDRQYLPATYAVFDFPHPDVHASHRNETLVSQQALFFLNSPFVAARAKALAARAADADSGKRVQQFHQWLYQRAATPHEEESALKFIAAAEAEPPAEKMLAPWEQYAQVLMLANEFTYLD
ncbi:MAG TPA: DUF1549 and DUF1553 domain-containing protein [Verrucomicrobiales bacterium]|nr:DUF1549 and DUF1553 domain-containing protein [Verrucomicrobiales bacterium]